MLRSKKVAIPKPKEISARGHEKEKEMVSPRDLKPKKHQEEKRGSPEAYEKRRKKMKRSPCQRIKEES